MGLSALLRTEDDRPPPSSYRVLGGRREACHAFRKLCHGLLLAEGARIESYRASADYDEFTVTTMALWRTRQMVVRIYHRSVEPQDLDDVRDFVEANGASEATVLPARDADSPIEPPRGIQLVWPGEMADRITASALIRWEDETPTIAVDRLELLLSLSDVTRLLDPIGIQWLPSLALNELPASLADVDVQPQDLLEQKTFRLLTASFRFGGVRYGEARRGERLPDAVLYWPDSTSTAAMLDCKAASAGYRMESDHLLRFVGYWEALAPKLEARGHDLRYLIIVSSYFPGRDDEMHPVYGRAAELEERTGLKLCYVSASDLAWAAAEIEGADVQLDDRCRIDWAGILAHVLVRSEHFSEARVVVG
jgi:hypothetical protein